MRGGRYLHRRLRDVEHREIHELPVHARESIQDQISGKVGDVQQHAPLFGSSASGDLGVVGERDAVACRKLESLGVVPLHEALARGVSEDAAFPSHSLRDEGARRLFGKHHPGGMELDELHVPEPAAGFGGEAHRIARVLVAPRGGTPPDARVTTGSEHDCVGHDQLAAAVVDVEAVGAEDAAVMHEQAGDVQVIAHLDADLRCASPRVSWISRPV